MYDSMYRTAGDMYGDGWWSDAKSAFHHGVSAIQHSDTVRAAEKALVKKGAKARGARRALGQLEALPTVTWRSPVKTVSVDLRNALAKLCS